MEIYSLGKTGAASHHEDVRTIQVITHRKAFHLHFSTDPGRLLRYGSLTMQSKNASLTFVNENPDISRMLQ